MYRVIRFVRVCDRRYHEEFESFRKSIWILNAKGKEGISSCFLSPFRNRVWPIGRTVHTTDTLCLDRIKIPPLFQRDRLNIADLATRKASIEF